MTRAGVLATAALCALAATPARCDESLSFVVADRAFGVSDGLPAAQVLSLHEDKAGAIWVGTTAGLARLGGQEIRVFGLADGLPRNEIYAIQEDADGVLFAGTLGGIVRYDGRSFRPEGGPAAEALRVRSLERGPQGSLYALLGRNTILRRGDGAWEALKLPEGLLFEGVALAVDEQEEIWVATRSTGLLHFTAGAGKTLRLIGRFGDAEGFPGDEAFFVIADGSGVAATARDAVLRIGHASVKRIPLARDLASGHRALARAADGELYVGTDTGVARVDATGVTAVRSSRNLARTAVVRLLTDRAGNLWLGTVNRGLAVLLTGTGVSYLRVGDSDLRGIDCDGDAFCWVSTGRDLYRFRLNEKGAPSELVRVPHEGIEPGPFFGFQPSENGDILVATANGVGVLDAATRRGPQPLLRRDRRFSALRETFVAALRRDGTGAFWALTNGGLFSLGRGQGEAVPFREGNLPVETGLALTIDGTDAVWLNDHHGALWRLSPGPERHAQVISLGGAADRPVDQLATDAKGHVLVSFEDGSWGAVDPATRSLRTRMPATSDLARLAFESLATLPDGRMVAAHAGGRLSVIAMDPPRLVTPILSSADLDGADFRYLSAQVAKGNALWLTTLGAVARLDSVRPVAPPPPLVVTSLETENATSGSTAGTPRLGPRPNAVDLVLSLAEPLAPRQVRYRWRLLGEANRWSSWTSDPRVRISNLAGGAFTFEAEARDRHGRQVSPTVRVPIEVDPLPWETWPFRGVIAALVGLIGYGALRWRVHSLERDRRRLEEAVAARNAELAAANRELREASLTDPLTALRNRRYFDLVIEEAASRARRAHAGSPPNPRPKNPDMIFYLVDLDRFKEVNDSFGHQAGDVVLVETARRLTSIVRQSDLVIRWGGEEFLVVSREGRREEGNVLASRILRAIGEAPFVLGDGRSRRCTCSVGWAPFPWRPETPGAIPHGEVLTLADRALYRAKEARNQAVGMLSDPGSGGGEEPSLRLILTPGPLSNPAPGVS
jgi:diguanylate cyclase (GGDEF)-like protein